MLECEAGWIAGILAGMDDTALSPLLNLGGSTHDFRTRVQPCIDELLVRPLKRRGVEVVHADLKDGDGVDISADFLSDEGLGRLCAVGSRSVLCCNLLEHVSHVEDAASRIASLVPSGGTLIVTVPNSYPYHADPIDNGFRPSASELAELFPGFSVHSSAIVEGPTLVDEFRANPTLLLRRVGRSLAPFPRPRGWLSTMDRWRWLLRPYKVACVALIKL